MARSTCHLILVQLDYSFFPSAYLAGVIPAPISNFTTKKLSNGSFAVAFTGKASSDTDEIFNPETAAKPLSSAREYDTVLIRWWDTYYTAQRDTIFYTTLETRDGGSKFGLSKSGLVNALRGTGLENPTFPPSIGEGKEFDISTAGIIFTARDPKINPAKTVQVNLYYIPLSDFTESPAPKAHEIRSPQEKGSISSAVFSPDGKSVAFLAQKAFDDQYIDKVIVVGKLDHSVKGGLQIVLRADMSPQNPDAVQWSNDSKELYLKAEDRGRGKLYNLNLTGSGRLKALTSDGVVAAVYPLTDSPSEKRLFVSKTSLVDSSVFTIVDSYTGTTRLVSSASNHGSALGLSHSQVSEIVFNGAGDYEVQAWVLKPSNFSPHQKYPLALLIHGGPVSSWTDSWSTRWNPAVFAEQGYVVVSPNPTGSTGFGQDYVDAIKGEWGGRTYQDIVKCFEYVEKNLKYIDTNRAVALGGSYGGYMMNWIAGQPLSKRLKALVCHDGIFSMYNMLSSDITCPLKDDFGGYLWQNKPGWDKHDPAQHTSAWSTPMLIIHSDKDYRCPITEGLAAMNVCQERGIESRYLTFPDENHFVLKRENSLKWYHTVLGWINKFARVEGGVVLGPPVSEPGKHAWKEDM